MRRTPLSCDRRLSGIASCNRSHVSNGTSLHTQWSMIASLMSHDFWKFWSEEKWQFIDTDILLEYTRHSERKWDYCGPWLSNSVVTLFMVFCTSNIKNCYHGWKVHVTTIALYNITPHMCCMNLIMHIHVCMRTPWALSKISCSQNLSFSLHA